MLTRGGVNHCWFPFFSRPTSSSKGLNTHTHIHRTRKRQRDGPRQCCPSLTTIYPDFLISGANFWPLTLNVNCLHRTLTIHISMTTDLDCVHSRHIQQCVFSSFLLFIFYPKINLKKLQVLTIFLHVPFSGSQAVSYFMKLRSPTYKFGHPIIDIF